jgi:hypothetical protein
MSVNVIPWNSIVLWSCDSAKWSKRTAEDFGFVQSCGQSPELTALFNYRYWSISSFKNHQKSIQSTVYTLLYVKSIEIPYWYGGSLKMWDPQVITVVSIRCQGLIWSNKIWEYPHDFGNLDIWYIPWLKIQSIPMGYCRPWWKSHPPGERPHHRQRTMDAPKARLQTCQWWWFLFFSNVPNVEWFTKRTNL